MEPLRIECRFAGPWCPQAFGLHLDGLVGWSLVEQVVRDGNPPNDYQEILRDLPFERHPSGVWCASLFSVVNWRGQERRHFTTRASAEDLALRIARGVVEPDGASSLDTSRGPAKNGQGFYTIEYAAGARAWCVGDPERILALLDRVNAIGGRTRVGRGELLPYNDGTLWRVVEDHEARERWKHRAAPLPLTDQALQAIGSWRPPYWRGNELIWRPPVNRIEEPAEAVA